MGDTLYTLCLLAFHQKHILQILCSFLFTNVTCAVGILDRRQLHRCATGSSCVSRCTLLRRTRCHYASHRGFARCFMAVADITHTMSAYIALLDHTHRTTVGRLVLVCRTICARQFITAFNLVSQYPCHCFFLCCQLNFHSKEAYGTALS